MSIRRIKNIVTACRQIAFPPVCVCCGLSVYSTGRLLCEICRQERFEQANYLPDEILPVSVWHHYSLWAFDKGGYLQSLLHTLKYHHLNHLGLELGQYLGESYIESPEYQYSEMKRERGFMLIPVPLHKKKQRVRGYNQARVIAEGISSVTGWNIVPEGMVIRSKNTPSQTGLTTEERSENVRGAFEWTMESVRIRETPVVIDDVFTTGATVFELTDSIRKVTGEKSVILTLARA